MPLLGALLVNLFSSLASFFALFLTKKAAFIAASVTAAMSLLAALAGALSALAAGLVLSAPGDSWFLTGLYFGVPSNAAICLSVALTADAAGMVYRLGQEHLSRALQA